MAGELIASGAVPEIHDSEAGWDAVQQINDCLGSALKASQLAIQQLLFCPLSTSVLSPVATPTLHDAELSIRGLSVLNACMSRAGLPLISGKVISPEDLLVALYCAEGIQVTLGLTLRERSLNVVDCLNNLLGEDRQGVGTLLLQHYPCRQELADHPHVVVDEDLRLGQDLFGVSLLGLLNGILHCISAPKIASMHRSLHTGQEQVQYLEGFCLYGETPTEEASAGLYWVRLKQKPDHWPTDWTIALYTPFFQDGSANPMPWEFLGDERLYAQDCIVEIGVKLISPPSPS